MNTGSSKGIRRPLPSTAPLPTSPQTYDNLDRLEDYTCQLYVLGLQNHKRLLESGSGADVWFPPKYTAWLAHRIRMELPELIEGISHTYTGRNTLYVRTLYRVLKRAHETANTSDVFPVLPFPDYEHWFDYELLALLHAQKRSEDEERGVLARVHAENSHKDDTFVLPSPKLSNHISTSSSKTTDSVTAFQSAGVKNQNQNQNQEIHSKEDFFSVYQTLKLSHELLETSSAFLPFDDWHIRELCKRIEQEEAKFELVQDYATLQAFRSQLYDIEKQRFERLFSKSGGSFEVFEDWHHGHLLVRLTSLENEIKSGKGDKQRLRNCRMQLYEVERGRFNGKDASGSQYASFDDWETREQMRLEREIQEKEEREREHRTWRVLNFN
jgi:hypothetical protein